MAQRLTLTALVTCLSATIALAAGGKPRATAVSRFAGVDGVRLHYVDWGGGGPWLLLVPGGCDTAFVFGDIAPALTSTHHVVGLTPRGCGQSDRPAEGYDLSSQVEEIRAFADTLGAERFSLAGHSSGSGTLTQFAKRYPTRVDRLIYFDPVFRFVAPGLDDLMSTAIGRVVGTNMMASLTAWRKTSRVWELGVWTPAMERDLQEKVTVDATGRLHFLRPEPARRSEQVTRDMESGAYFETSIARPALLIFAMDTDRDRLRAFDRETRQRLLPLVEATEQRRGDEINDFRRANPSARIVEIRHASHYVFAHKPREVIREIERFLAAPASQ